MNEKEQGCLFAGRKVVWFSCGSASACAAKLAIEAYGNSVEVVYCDTSANEHPDNMRFLEDVERWIAKPITRIKSTEFGTVEDVFRVCRYMSGPNGARCTTELKKKPRQAFQWVNDCHIFGFTVDEKKRIEAFKMGNPELFVEFILSDRNVSKKDCYTMISKAGIKLPEMYLIGYPHNNCIGCVKATSSGYWNKIRRDFPDVFKRRCEQSRELSVRLVKLNGERIFLNDLPEGENGHWKDEVISCGPECG